MALTMSVDGYDTSNIGFDVWDWDARTAPEREWVTMKAPLRHDRVLTSGTPEYGARSLEVEGRLGGTSQANFESNRDELLARLDGPDATRITFSDQPDRFYLARLTEFSHDHITKASLTRDEITLVFDLLRPFAYATTLSAVSFDSTPTLIPLGTAPVTDWVMRIYGSFTDPSVTVRRAGLFHYQPAAGITPSGQSFSRGATATYQDAAGILRTAGSTDLRNVHYVDDATSDDMSYADTAGGSTLYTLSFTLSKAGNEYLEIDRGKGTITDNDGNSEQAKRDTGTDFPFDLDPRDGRFESADWLQIEVDSGSGVLEYRKAYA